MFIIDKIFLFPYYFILKLRHSLYNLKALRSYSYDVPIISVGNITVGGTGKTPHVEMLVSLLKDEYKIAVISRGYKRKTSGYRVVSLSDTYRQVGDEPIQIKRKFPEIIVAVDVSRKRAIEKLLALDKEERPTLILLDDAFQHRRVKPSLSILLVDYSFPIFQDHLLPIGRLRDLPTEIKRANIVIVTKSPEYVDDNEKTKWRKKLHLKENQPLFMSKIKYLFPKPIFPEADNRYLYSKNAILFSGIANDAPLRLYLSSQYKLVSITKFEDHHNYSSSEIRLIEKDSMKYSTSIILTTEKDAQRIFNHPKITLGLKTRMFYVPIESEVIPDIQHLERVIPEEMKDIGIKQLKEKLIQYNITPTKNTSV